MLATTTEVKKCGGSDIVTGIFLAWLKYEDNSRSILLKYMEDFGVPIARYIGNMEEVGRIPLTPSSTLTKKREHYCMEKGDAHGVDEDVSAEISHKS